MVGEDWLASFLFKSRPSLERFGLSVITTTVTLLDYNCWHHQHRQVFKKEATEKVPQANNERQ
jgi:hypothetical protein